MIWNSVIIIYQYYSSKTFLTEPRGGRCFKILLKVIYELQ